MSGPFLQIDGQISLLENSLQTDSGSMFISGGIPADPLEEFAKMIDPTGKWYAHAERFVKPGGRNILAVVAKVHEMIPVRRSLV